MRCIGNRYLCIMTLNELQVKLQQEQLKQIDLTTNEIIRKANQQLEVLNSLNSYLPKVNEWLQMLNMISQSGVRYYICSSNYIKQDVLKKSWEVITNGITHKFGIYCPRVKYGEAITKGHFTKMGCEGGGCNGDDVWTDGKNWYHGKLKLIGTIGEISMYKAKRIIEEIQEFETYFEGLIKELGK